MTHLTRQQLFLQIEKTRKEMEHHILQQKSLTSKEVLKVSKRLDALLLEYYHCVFSKNSHKHVG